MKYLYCFSSSLVLAIYKSSQKKKSRRQTTITAMRVKSFYPKPEPRVNLSTTHLSSLCHSIHNFAKLMKNQSMQAYLLIYFFKARPSVQFYKHLQ